jgi:hypothetical protein
MPGGLWISGGLWSEGGPEGSGSMLEDAVASVGGSRLAAEGAVAQVWLARGAEDARAEGSALVDGGGWDDIEADRACESVGPPLVMLSWAVGRCRA